MIKTEPKDYKNRTYLSAIEAAKYLSISVEMLHLNFQHELIDINKDRLAYLLQGVIDENQIVKIIPKDLDSFFKVCFILDNLNKAPQNANLWLIYLLSYINVCLGFINHG